MSTCISVICLHSSAIKNGLTDKRVQRYKCKKCGQNFVLDNIPLWTRDLVIKNREKYVQRVIRNKVRYLQELNGFQLMDAINKRRKIEGLKDE